MSDSPKLKLLLAIAPMIPAFLYLVGFSYYQGYLEGFDLEPSLFPISLDVMKVFVIASFVVLIVVATLLILLLLLSTKIAEKFHQWFESIKKKRKGNKKEILGEKKITSILDFIENYFFKYFGIGFVFFVLITLVSIQTQKNGKLLAEKHIASFSKKEGKWVEVYEVDSQKPLNAFQITCGPEHCAFWKGNEALILTHDKIQKVVAHKYKGKEIIKK